MDSENLTKRELKEQRRREKIASNMKNDSGGSITKWIVIILGSVLFLAFFGFVVFLIKQSKNKPVAITKAGYVRGSEKAKVELVEFGDLQCPACKAYEPIVRKTMKEFDGKVKLLYKHFPLTSVHKNAMLAAKVAVAAGNQNKFWEMHDWLYDHQEEWAQLSASEAKDKMLAAATKMKVNMEQFKKDVNAKATEDAILATQTEGIDLGVASTPTFYVNNKKMDPQPSDYDSFKKIIQEALKNTK